MSSEQNPRSSPTPEASGDIEAGAAEVLAEKADAKEKTTTDISDETKDNRNVVPVTNADATEKSERSCVRPQPYLR